MIEPIQQLENSNWTLLKQHADDFFLAPEITTRYPNLPESYFLFLRHVSKCVNPDNSAWFLLSSDFNRTNSYSMAWDYVETCDRACAMGDGGLLKEIGAFWGRHIPIMHAVKSDISFVAICLSEESYGTVVHSYAPYFHEASVIAASFPQFLEMLANAAQGIYTGVNPDRVWILEDLA